MVKFNADTLARAHIEPLPGVRKLTFINISVEKVEVAEDPEEVDDSATFCRIIPVLSIDNNVDLKYKRWALSCQRES